MVNTCKYPWISDIKKIYGYPYNGYLHEYGYKYMADIYSVARVRKSYFPYLTRPVDMIYLNKINTRLS